jgi:hypothetical protein
MTGKCLPFLSPLGPVFKVIDPKLLPLLLSIYKLVAEFGHLIATFVEQGH